MLNLNEIQLIIEIMLNPTICIMNRHLKKNMLSYDQNGFEREQREYQAIKYLIDEEQQQIKKKIWVAFLPRILLLRSGGQAQQRQLILQVRTGVEDSLRHQVWPLLIQQPLVSFSDCCGAYENKDINLDLQRTFPTNKSAKQLEDKMKVVLNALAVAMPQLGYCQGMNFIVGTILLRLDLEPAFKMSYHIFHWQKQDRLLVSLDLIHEKVYALQRLILKHYPRLYKQLQFFEVQPLLYASSWFITLYCNCLPACYSFRVLECFLLEGQKILYRVALQIFKTKKKALKYQNSLEDIAEELKNYSEFNELNVDAFFRQAFSISLSRKEIEQYRQEYHHQKMEGLH